MAVRTPISCVKEEEEEDAAEAEEMEFFGPVWLINEQGGGCIHAAANEEDDK